MTSASRAPREKLRYTASPKGAPPAAAAARTQRGRSLAAARRRHRTNPIALRQPVAFQ